MKKTKILFVILAITLITACKKDNETIPDQIELNMSAIINLGNGDVSAQDSTRFKFVEVNDSTSSVVVYTDNSGKATVILKKNTEYVFSAITRTYNGPHYYFKKGEWFRSSWTSGKESYYQKGWPVYFYKEDKVDKTGSTVTMVPNPAL